jgi:enoyl-CoA hydratase/carnithine racemase
MEASIVNRRGLRPTIGVRQLRPARHQHAAQRPYPDQEGDLDALVGRNISGAEADRLGIVSHSVPAAELEGVTIGIAREIASRHLAPLEHAKVAVQMGRDLSLSQAIQLDQLVGARLRQSMDPTADIEAYLDSQKGRPNL